MLRELHSVERPRERLARLGPEALSEAELLALLLRTGYKGRGVTQVAGDVLRAVPEGLDRAGYPSLAGLKGVGPSRAAALVAAFELGRRRRGVDDGRPVLDSAARVFERVPREPRRSRKEHLLAFYLNARNQLLHQEIISIGTLSASLV
ncbi:MAG: hypothetical protein KGK30_03365, partial [Elusimicrobia bacterium]|nr:hypothetical protein [Elusimicrobiota bacterium]